MDCQQCRSHIRCAPKLKVRYGYFERSYRHMPLAKYRESKIRAMKRVRFNFFFGVFDFIIVFEAEKKSTASHYTGSCALTSSGTD